MWWGRKDAFPGADGSTITQVNPNATTIPIYGASGTALTEGSTTGLQLVNITTAGVLSGGNSLTYAIKHPLSFIYNAVFPYDWYTNADNHNDTLWGNDSDKSDFDPCPAGWRIAPNGTWSDFTKTEDVLQPINGNFPFYIKGITNEQGAVGDYHQTNGRLYKVSNTGIGTPLTWYPAAGTRNRINGRLYNCGIHGFSMSSLLKDTKAVILILERVCSMCLMKIQAEVVLLSVACRSSVRGREGAG